MGVDPGLRAQQALEQLLVRHLEAEDADRAPVAQGGMRRC
jgi:hypothetical protein